MASNFGKESIARLNAACKLPKESVVWLTDRPDMTSAAYGGRKTIKQTNKNIYVSNNRRELPFDFFSS